MSIIHYFIYKAQRGKVEVSFLMNDIYFIIRMIQQEPTVSKSSGLLVLSNSQKDFNLLKTLLSKYFPSPNQSQLHLDTKYYLADIQIVRRNWPQPQQIIDLSSQTEQQLSNKMNPEDKQNLLIMLVNSSQSFPSTMYDFVINKYNPQNFILIVNTKTKNLSWQDEQKISNQVNNFIQVIKQDLEELNNNPPQRLKKGLLADSYQDGNIFNLLQLIQTTPWPQIKRKIIEKKQNQNKGILPETKPITETKVEQKQKEDVMEEELTDQQLQKQMNAFQNLMGEMLNLKQISSQSSKISDSQRKKKAQDLMSKLLGAWM